VSKWTVECVGISLLGREDPCSNAFKRPESVAVTNIGKFSNRSVHEMTTVLRMSGGLGNQLFQLARAFALRAESPTTRVQLDRGWYDHRPSGHVRRDMELPQLIADLPVTALPNWVWAPRLRLSGSAGKRPLPSILLKKWGGLDLQDDYWQEWAVVHPVRDQLLCVLNHTRSAVHDAESFRSNFVAVHVRLGDYLSVDSTNGFHGPTNFEHQLELAQSQAVRLNLKRIVVFTDSPEIVLPRLSSVRGAVLSGAQSAWEVLHLMASAQSIVMSNSSLSWWSAVYAGWASDQPLEVLSPFPWFREQSKVDVALHVQGWRPYRRTLLV
jgi:hypothetical protein